MNLVDQKGLFIGAGTNMQQSPLAKMLSLYVFAGCVFAATYATAIEYRSRAKTHDPQFNVHVRPKFVEIHKGDSLTIKCRAKGGYKLSDIPMISFYRRLRDKRTVMPLSSASYGVTIRATSEQPTMNIRHRLRKYRLRKSSKLLYLDKQIYDILDYGANYFYCRASYMGGHRADALFVLFKV